MMTMGGQSMPQQQAGGMAAAPQQQLGMAGRMGSGGGAQMMQQGAPMGSGQQSMDDQSGRANMVSTGEWRMVMSVLL